jgi:hypothetical protein
MQEDFSRKGAKAKGKLKNHSGLCALCVFAGVMIFP